MKTYGYEVVNALVTDIVPDKKVINAMNQINAEKRLRCVKHRAGSIQAWQPTVTLSPEIQFP